MDSITLHKDGGISINGRRSGQWLQHWPAGTDRAAIRYSASVELADGRSITTDLARWGDLTGLLQSCMQEQPAIKA